MVCFVSNTARGAISLFGLLALSYALLLTLSKPLWDLRTEDSSLLTRLYQLELEITELKNDQVASEVLESVDDEKNPITNFPTVNLNSLPENRSIFFIETDDEALTFEKRHLCAFESAAEKNSARDVFVLLNTASKMLSIPGYL